VLVTQSPHANASGLAGCPEASQVLKSLAPRPDLSFVLHYQAPLSPEQQFEDLAWLPAGAHSLVLADSSDAALVQALLAQQRIKPAAIEAMAQALAQIPEDRPAYADTLALRAGTSRRSAERVLGAVLVLHDVTEQRRIDEELQRCRVEARLSPQPRLGGPNTSTSDSPLVERGQERDAQEEQRIAKCMQDKGYSAKR